MLLLYVVCCRAGVGVGVGGLYGRLPIGWFTGVRFETPGFIVDEILDCPMFWFCALNAEVLFLNC